MKFEQFILTLGGLAIIAAFFLPYLSLDLNPTVFGQEINIEGTEIVVSGYSMTETALNKADVLKEGVDNKWADGLWNAWQENASQDSQLKIIGLLFVLAAPFIFLLYSLGYIFKGLSGGQYKRGVFFNILFLGAAWAIFKFLLGMNFFAMAGLGYWVAFGGMMVAAFSLFFERASKK